MLPGHNLSVILITIAITVLTAGAEDNSVNAIKSAGKILVGSTHRLGVPGASSSESAAAVLVSFRSRPNNERGLGNGSLLINVTSSNSRIPIDSATSGSPIRDVDRLSVTVDGQPLPEQLAELVELLRTARATERLQFVGPVKLLSLYQPVRFLPKLTHLSAVCRESSNKLSSFELVAERDRTNQSLVEVQLHSCIRRNSTSVLLNNLASLVSAKYSGGRLDRLAVGEIRGLPNLRYLYLQRCDLASVDVGAFDDLRALLHLTLAGNPRLKRLPSGLFRYLTSLEQLNLRQNGLQNLASAFHGSLNRLVRLDLGANNLKWLPVGTFDGLGQLRTLLLGGNPLLQLTDRPCLALCSLISLRILQFDAEISEKEICSKLALNSTAGVRLTLPATARCPGDTGVELCRSNKVLQPLRTGGDQKQEEPLQRRQSYPSLALLLIIGAICTAHLVVTAALACFCWRAVSSQRQSRRRQGQMSVKAASVKLMSGDGDSEENETAENETPPSRGGGLVAASSSESAAAVLVSFRSRPNNERGLGNEYEIRDDFFPREKISYEFNEDA